MPGRAQIFISVYLFLFLYLGFSLILPAGLGWGLWVLAWAALGSMFLLIAWLPFVFWRRDDPESLNSARYLLPASFCAMGWMSFVLFLSFVHDVLAIALSWIGAISSGRFAVEAQDLAKYLHSARGSGLVLCLSLILFGLGVMIAHRGPAISRVKLTLPGLPPAFDGIRIVQISDLHISATLDVSAVSRVVRLSNSVKPDLVFFTGDLVDGMVTQLREKFIQLSNLKASLGSYYVTGNHEYYWDGEGWPQEAERIGIRVLSNSHQILRKANDAILVAGIPDPAGAEVAGASAPDLSEAILGAPEDAFKILLSHRPNPADKASQLGFDLMLSGHTHGGQFVPWTWVIRLFQKYVKGLYPVGPMWLYVSRGTGYWGPPLRLGAPPELTVLELFSSNSKIRTG